MRALAQSRAHRRSSAYFAGDADDGRDPRRAASARREGNGDAERRSYSFQPTTSMTGVIVFAAVGRRRASRAWFIDRIEPDGDAWRADLADLQVQPAGVATVGRDDGCGNAGRHRRHPRGGRGASRQQGGNARNSRCAQLQALHANKYPGPAQPRGGGPSPDGSRPSRQLRAASRSASPSLLSLHRPLAGRSAPIVAFSVSATYYFIDIFLTSLGESRRYSRPCWRSGDPPRAVPVARRAWRSCSRSAHEPALREATAICRGRSSVSS